MKGKDKHIHTHTLSLSSLSLTHTRSLALVVLVIEGAFLRGCAFSFLLSFLRVIAAFPFALPLSRSLSRSTSSPSALFSNALSALHPSPSRSRVFSRATKSTPFQRPKTSNDPHFPALSMPLSPPARARTPRAPLPTRTRSSQTRTIAFFLLTTSHTAKSVKP